MKQIDRFLELVGSWVWGPPLLFAFVICGLVFSFRLGFYQLFGLKTGLATIFRRDTASKGDLTHYEAFCLSLAGVLGGGNIAGVATAVALGGVGSIFWLWVMAFLSMATKYAEAVLAHRFRIQNADGNYSGGPMYYIEHGLRWRFGAFFFAACCAFSTLFTRMAQARTISYALNEIFEVPHFLVGLALAALLAVVLYGGGRSQALLASLYLPLMLAFYCICGLSIVILRLEDLPTALWHIVSSAFYPDALIGGLAGVSIWTVIQQGAMRGAFSNEAGMGSTPIIAASAKSDHACRQAVVSMTVVFWDSLIVCTLTGLIIALSQIGPIGPAQSSSVDILQGLELATAAFSQVLPLAGRVIVTVSLLFFVFGNMVGWVFCGTKAAEYLFGTGVIPMYHALLVLLLIPGSLLSFETLWRLAEIVGGLMAIPNVIALLGLSGIVVKEHREFLQLLRKEADSLD